MSKAGGAWKKSVALRVSPTRPMHSLVIANDDTGFKSGSASPGGKRPCRTPVLKDLGTLKEHLAKWPISGRRRRWLDDRKDAGCAVDGLDRDPTRRSVHWRHDD